MKDLRTTRSFRRPGLGALAAILTCLGLVAATPASAESGGVDTVGSDQPAGATATLARDGTAIPPASAPPRIVKVIEAANRIEDKPYVYGGGHGKWNDSGYDCSGSVSYALHGGGFLRSPLPSTSFMSWGEPGRGKWITVYANGGHAYAVIAGLRWDTSMTPGNGPGWSEQMRSPSGYRVRHPLGA